MVPTASDITAVSDLADAYPGQDLAQFYDFGCSAPKEANDQRMTD